MLLRMSTDDEHGALFSSTLPEISGGDDKLLESLGTASETSPQMAVTGGGAFKPLA